MNREIKFKMWGGNKMFYDIENVYACLMQQIAFNCTQPNSHQIPYDHSGLFGAVWLQYIGVKDKNGKEIYHGDIVSNGSDKIHRRVIVWDRATFWFKQIHGEGNFPVQLSTYSEMTYEVIGNIYENPELLK